jgi:hypothetical protein
VLTLKKIVIATLIGLFLFCYSGFAFATADSTSNYQLIAGGGASKNLGIKVYKRFTGSIKVLDIQNMTIMLYQKKEDRELIADFFVDHSTVITLGKERKTIADLKEGAQVTVVYTKCPNGYLAEKIMIKADSAN